MARIVRVLHAALLAGLLAVAGTLYVLERLNGPLIPDSRVVGTTLAGAGAAMLMAVLLILRPRIPERRTDQSPELYWSDLRTRGLALAAWAVAEGAGVVGAVGYLLTGGAAPATAAVLAVLLLTWLRPGYLEGG